MDAQLPRQTRLVMADDLQDSLLPLGRATVVLQLGGEKRRFRVNAASLRLLPGRRRVCLGFDGPQGSVSIEIPKVAFWRLTASFHERSIAADDPGPKQRSTRGKRS